MIVGPRNFTTKKVKVGHLDSVLLSKPSYTTVDDPFKKAVEKIYRDSVHDGHKPLHDIVHKPAKTVKERYYHAAYEHMTDRVEVKKDYRDADGGVITGPKNFYTMPPKKGMVGKRTFFNNLPGAIVDDFNWPRKVARKEMEELKKLEQEKPFSQRAKTWGGFNKTREVIGEEPAIPHRKAKEEMAPPMEQEVAFKPAKPARSGYSCTFEKFPNYMENPLKFTQRMKPVEGEEVAPAFKTATRFRSRPSPSVVTNLRNLKSSFPSIFKH